MDLTNARLSYGRQCKYAILGSWLRFDSRHQLGDLARGLEGSTRGFWAFNWQASQLIYISL